MKLGKSSHGAGGSLQSKPFGVTVPGGLVEAQESWIQISKANADIARPGRLQRETDLSADVVLVYASIATWEWNIYLHIR